MNDKISNVTFSNSGSVLLLSNQYNELGELINKKLHDDGDNFAQSVDYRYNIRGWLTRINNADLSADNASEKTDLFGMELGYTDNFGLTAEAQYNGNIAAVKWGGKRNDINVDKVVQQNAYGYAYDGVNRITEANFYESASQNPGQKYQLRINEYDQNGNIKQLQRRNATGGLIDSLTYDYSSSGNQLKYVSDAVTDSSGFIDGNTSGNDYTYDDNGNMISDANKGINSIKYNNLNLPEEVSFANGNKIVYFYDASGAKLRQEVYENNVLQKATDYIGSLILENDTLQFIQTAEGRVVPKTVDGVDKNEYQYHLKDHLGNVRTTFAVRDDLFETSFEIDTTDHPYFENYGQIERLQNYMKRSGDKTHRLVGGGTDVVGLMKTLYVSKGDKVSAEVYGKYLDAQFSDEAINGVALVDALVTMLGGGAISGEGTVVQNNLNSDYISAAMADGSQETSPKAYLNYILFDKNFTYLNSGFERLAASAADPGDGSGTHQKLSFEEIQIEEDGYLMVFLSNESQQEVEVFWDDFKVEHHYNAVLQADDYYPFGLTFNSYTRSYSKANDYKYQSKEEMQELGAGTFDFHARMYDATLGRTWQTDPLSDKYLSFSPYSWVANNPIFYTDPTGMEIDWSQVSGREKRLIRRALRRHNSSSTYKSLYKQLKKSDNRYLIKSTYDENTLTGASFDGNSSSTFEGPDGESSTLQTPATEDDFGENEKGGTISFNMATVDVLDKKDQVSLLGSFAAEEVVHAAQYDDANQQDNSAGLPGTANTEFEAKAIVGQIQSESRRDLWTSGVDKTANNFGVRSFNAGSVNIKNYQTQLKKWHTDPNLGRTYSARRRTSQMPSLLMKLVKPK